MCHAKTQGKFQSEAQGTVEANVCKPDQSSLQKQGRIQCKPQHSQKACPHGAVG
eukprot:gene25982-32497_t